MPSPKKPSRLGAAGLAVLSLAALPTAVYAFDDKIESDIKHVIECLTWMVNDPPRYIANCTPSRPREVMESSVTNKPRPSSSVSSSEPSSSSSVSRRSGDLPRSPCLHGRGRSTSRSSSPRSTPSRPRSRACSRSGRTLTRSSRWTVSATCSRRSGARRLRSSSSTPPHKAWTRR